MHFLRHHHHHLSHLPIRALLVQNTVSALFAPNGVALLQDDFGIAVTAEVVDGFRGIFEGAAACDVEAALRGVGAGVGGVLLATEGGRGVLFARHGAVRRRGVWLVVGAVVDCECLTVKARASASKLGSWL